MARDPREQELRWALAAALEQVGDAQKDTRVHNYAGPAVEAERAAWDVLEQRLKEYQAYLDQAHPARQPG